MPQWSIHGNIVLESSCTIISSLSIRQYIISLFRAFLSFLHEQREDLISIDSFCWCYLLHVLTVPSVPAAARVRTTLLTIKPASCLLLCNYPHPRLNYCRNTHSILSECSRNHCCYLWPQFNLMRESICHDDHLVVSNMWVKHFIALLSWGALDPLVNRWCSKLHGAVLCPLEDMIMLDGFEKSSWQDKFCYFWITALFLI